MIAPANYKYFHTIFSSATITLQYRHLIYSDQIVSFIFTKYAYNSYIPATHFSLVFVHDRMIRSKKRPVPVSGKSAITNFLVRINNEPSLSESSISESESVQDVASDHKTSQLPTKRSKQRASRFDSS